MIWNIVTDSSCDLKFLNESNADNEIRYTSIPFIISVEKDDFVDDDNLHLEKMLDAMEISREASHTSCPAPHAWQEAFEQEGNVIAITISKELSGSYNSACVAESMMKEDHPDKNIAVINSVSAGPALIFLVRSLIHDIKAGKSFDEAVANARSIAARYNTIFALCSFDNLVKNGRMSKITGFIASKFGFWGLGVASREGKIVLKGKERTKKKVVAAFINDIRENVAEPTRLLISHCQNLEMAELLKAAVREVWPQIDIEIHDTKGLCSYYAERHGLIVTYL